MSRPFIIIVALLAWGLTERVEAQTTNPAEPIATLNDPAFKEWMKDVAALPGEMQVEAVAKKLQELNIEFDGKVTDFDKKGPPKIQDGVVTEFGFVATRYLRDISPVRALTGLTKLSCSGEYGRPGGVSDLSPLQGMKLTHLQCSSNPISELSPLKGMPLIQLFVACSSVSDLSSLKGMPLTKLVCRESQVSDLSPLQEMKLTALWCGNTKVSDLALLKGMPLTHLEFGVTSVSDLSPLKGMPLENLHCHATPISDLSSLADCKSLTFLFIRSTKVTPAAVAALQEALPKCKIVSDYPASVTTPLPASFDNK